MEVNEYDVLVVGAGLSGIDAAYRIQSECPGRTYAILEGRSSLGGTWDLFRYPGVRSDSDMVTLGYPFSPWANPKTIADGSEIREYIRHTARNYGIDRHIRFDRKVTAATWSSAEARWTVTVEADGELETYTCSFLYLCCGYYSYSGGFAPDFPDKDVFCGPVIHPQHWPDDLDYAGKRVVIIGSGATAVTLVPAMAERAAHVTMLQRSPTYINALPATDPIANALIGFLPPRSLDSLLRWKNAFLTTAFYQFSQRFPRQAKKLLRSQAVKHLEGVVDVDPHFTPHYNPWDQRMCLAPDGDFFAALRSRKASIVTDTISRFTESGIELDSGAHLDADIIVTATGLKVVAAGEIELSVDGTRIQLADEFVYKGLMFSGIPNLGWCIGYTNASWTLRADLSSRYVCRLLNYLDRHSFDYAMPDPAGSHLEQRPIMDLSSGYIERARGLLPKQGSEAPWRLRQNYFLDYFTMRFSPVEESMSFGRRQSVPRSHALT
ncbi:flavin-containing monooxygenase [Nocardia nova]|uniref:flavin-containing monooxygenase n=1 Tax=Nocardia nova TaxID=37330 RepID=UPI0033DFA367